MKLLIVEDEDIIRQMLSDILNEAGHEVITARTGDEAISILKDTTVDRIVTDLMMPGLSGVELLYQLRQSKIPVVVMSGLSREVIIEELLAELGIAGVLQKPINEDDLINCLNIDLNA